MTAADRCLAQAVRWLCVAGDTVMTPRLSVLILHRVVPAQDPLFPVEMHAQRFDRLLALLARSFQVLPLGPAVALQQAGRLPARALAITFDDGYADNAEVALPLLRRHGLRATFFVATGFLDGGRMFNDSVIETLRRCSLPEVDLRPWGEGVVALHSTVQRRHTIWKLLDKFKYFSLPQRQQALAQLHECAGAPPLPTDLMMRSEQVQQLHRAGMEIGGHTVNHPILKVLPDADAEREIDEGRRALQAITGDAVEVFAYPNGRPGKDYDQRHVQMVRRLGFKAAVSTAVGVVRSGSDLFQLPRFTPWDASHPRFAGQLLRQRWMGTQPILAH